MNRTGYSNTRRMSRLRVFGESPLFVHHCHFRISVEGEKGEPKQGLAIVHVWMRMFT